MLQFFCTFLAFWCDMSTSNKNPVSLFWFNSKFNKYLRNEEKILRTLILHGFLKSLASFCITLHDEDYDVTKDGQVQRSTDFCSRFMGLFGRAVLETNEQKLRLGKLSFYSPIQCASERLDPLIWVTKRLTLHTVCLRVWCLCVFVPIDVSMCMCICISAFILCLQLRQSHLRKWHVFCNS